MSTMITTTAGTKLDTKPGGHLTFLGSAFAFAEREFRDAISSRWFVLYTVSFTALAVAVSFMSLAGVGAHGFAGFGRTTAGLLNLVMLIVPLMAIIAGTGSIAGERERGTLLYLLAQPVTRVEVLLGKFLGLAIALCCSIWFGFGISAIVLAIIAGGSGVASFAVLVLLTSILAMAMLAIGMLISSISRRNGVATGIGLFAWFTLVFLSDLGLMAGTLIFKLRAQEIFAVAALNPLQAFKMSVVLSMNASLDVLGPVGAYATQTFGSALPWLLAGVLLLWVMVPLAIATVIFKRGSAA